MVIDLGITAGHSRFTKLRGALTPQSRPGALARRAARLLRCRRATMRGVAGRSPGAWSWGSTATTTTLRDRGLLRAPLLRRRRERSDRVARRPPARRPDEDAGRGGNRPRGALVKSRPPKAAPWDYQEGHVGSSSWHSRRWVPLQPARLHTSTTSWTRRWWRITERASVGASRRSTWRRSSASWRRRTRRTASRARRPTDRSARLRVRARGPGASIRRDRSPPRDICVQTGLPSVRRTE